MRANRFGSLIAAGWGISSRIKLGYAPQFSLVFLYLLELKNEAFVSSQNRVYPD